MNKLTVAFTAICMMMHVIAAAQKSSSDTKEKYSVPFELTSYNNIVIKSILNNYDTVNLMLHTAASDVTLTEDASARLKTIKFIGSVDSVKSWGGNNNSSDFSKNNSLTIAGMSWDSITIWKDQNSGQETDGKFGLNLFENKIISIDFDKKLLTVETNLPAAIRQYQKFKLLKKDDELFISAVCQTKNGAFENEFLIHSGYGGDVLLDDEFINKNNIEQQIKITGEKKLQDAYGNTITTKKGILPFFKIGKLQLVNVPVGFFEGVIGNQKMSVIGCDIIKRFNWIIDAKKEIIYVKPNLFYNEPLL